MFWAAWIAAAFLSGSIPTGLLIARARNIDIRAKGSGNIGATNIARVFGARLGLLCLAADAFKGFAPTFAAGAAAGLLHPSIRVHPIDGTSAWCWLSVMSAAVLGHMFSPWAGFRGGKGVATTLGCLLAIWPYLTLPALFALVLWIAITAWTRYISLASCLAAASIPAYVFLCARVSTSPMPSLQPFYVATSALAFLIILRHHANLRRLLAGTENRLGSHPRN